VSQAELLEAETSATDAMFVVLSDVHLDSSRVLRALRVLFSGYASIPTPPLLFVLMGNFTSRPLSIGADAVAVMSGLFGKLGDIICDYPELVERSQFVILPGPQDLTAGSALPRPRIPAVFVRDLQARINVTFTSSVARIRYYTQEIVISRHDLLAEMRRNTVLGTGAAAAGKAGDDGLCDFFFF
jgi:DNA polymerase epsilon subunit 2